MKSARAEPVESPENAKTPLELVSVYSFRRSRSNEPPKAILWRPFTQRSESTHVKPARGNLPGGKVPKLKKPETLIPSSAFIDPCVMGTPNCRTEGEFPGGPRRSVSYNTPKRKSFRR